MEKALQNLISKIQNSDEFFQYKQAKEELSEDESICSLVKEYTKLRIKLQADKVSCNQQSETENRMKKIMDLLQDSDSAMNYFIAEFKVQKMVSDICSSLMKAADLEMFD